jgi:hypothetical protein
MVKRTCACSLESGARRAPAARMARALNGLNLNRGRPVTLERKSRIRKPRLGEGRKKKSNAFIASGFRRLGAAARMPSVSPREPRRSLIHARGHARALGTDGLRVSHVGTNRPRRPRSDCRRDSLCHSLGERFPTFSGRILQRNSSLLCGETRVGSHHDQGFHRGEQPRYVSPFT